jgi:N-carbamoyl-L-amino-acid hydrolase
MEVWPGAPNVVPGRCQLVVDVRCSDMTVTDRLAALLDADSLAAAALARVERAGMTVLSDGPPVVCDERLRG